MRTPIPAPLPIADDAARRLSLPAEVSAWLPFPSFPRLSLRLLFYVHAPFLQLPAHKVFKKVTCDKPTLNAGAAKRPPQSRFRIQRDLYSHTLVLLYFNV